MDNFLYTDLNSIEETEAALAIGLAKRLNTLAKHLGASPTNAELVGQAAAHISRATSHGHVCVPLAPLAGQLTAQPNHPLSTIRANLFASGVVCDGRAANVELLPLVLDVEDRLYLARYYAYERRLAKALIKRSEALKTIAADEEKTGVIQELSSLHERLARYFKAPLVNDGKDEIDIQQVATALTLSNSLTIISGGPGTGKTTTVVGMLACLLEAEPTLRIALAAPTGRAAQRLAQALAFNAHHLPTALAARLPSTASTLHRLLGNPHLRRSLPHSQAAALPYDVVIVDEASMLDITLAVQLIEALAPTTKLILLGDKNQLSAVEAGAVFAELSAQPVWTQPYLKQLASSLKIDQERLTAALPTAPNSTLHPLLKQELTFKPLANCVIWLERNYRFAADSGIGCLSRAINAGSPAETLAVLTAQANNPAAEVVLLEDTEAALSEPTLIQLAAGFEPYVQALATALRSMSENDAALDCTLLFAALNRYRVLSAMRDGLRGVEKLNTLLTWYVRQAISRLTKQITKLHDQTTSPSHDTKHEWFAGRPIMIMRNVYALELFNGDIGIALPYGKDALRIVFPTPQGGWRWFSPATLPPYETAFAMTVHKSQGSEFARAAIVLPATPTRTLTRALLYTAVTRARSQVMIVGARAILTYAVTNAAQRHSGLTARLQEAVAAMQSEERDKRNTK